MIKRKLNWHPSLPDFRDVKYATLLEAAVLLVSKADLRPVDSPIFDQGQLGSCTMNAGCGAFDFLELQEIRTKNPGKEVFQSGLFVIASRLFGYYCERADDGDPGQDGGSSLRECIMAIRNYGLCRETTWPYDVNQFAVKPPAAAYAEAALHKEVHHYAINTLADMKRCLTNGYPWILGITVYDSFMEVGSDGLVPIPGPDESIQGGHALMCVGFDDSKQLFTVRNSWGAGFGDKGYCYFPYAYLTNPDLASDFWTLRRT